MISWPRPSKRSASVRGPRSPSKVYCFSTSSQGRSRRSRLNWSRIRVNSFSFARCFFRALIHSSCFTTLWGGNVIPPSREVWLARAVWLDHECVGTSRCQGEDTARAGIPEARAAPKYDQVVSRVSADRNFYSMCFHCTPHGQACRSSSCPDGLSQWWRLPSSVSLSVPHSPCSVGLALAHQLVIGLVCTRLIGWSSSVLADTLRGPPSSCDAEPRDQSTRVMVMIQFF